MFPHANVVSLCLVCTVHPAAVLNAAFGITCSLLMLVEDARGDHMEESYSRAGLMHECLLLLPHPAAPSAFIICRGLCACTEML